MDKPDPGILINITDSYLPSLPQPDHFLQYMTGTIFIIILIALTFFFHKWWDMR